jgi:fermentation-respiration switch protein FrsA (DUF1100 family)
MVNMPTAADLPDLFIFNDGRRVATTAEWPARRAELLEALQAIQYGHLPPPLAVAACRLSSSTVSRQEGLTATHYRLTAGPDGLSWLVTLYLPADTGPFPVVVDGDGCWRDVTDEVLFAVARRGYALAIFNRVELAADDSSSGRNIGLYSAFPGGDFGALAAWAWGYHRVVDFLQHLPGIAPTRIAVTGHSRGGKAALLAGATDERIALTAPNNSGCCGAGCSRFPDEGGERLADITPSFPYWFSPRLREYVGRESELPFDQHALKAAVAPRPLLSTEARGDIWASPRGTRLTHEAAREIYRFLGVENRIGIWYRDGGHAHTLQDWKALLDFADLRFFGKAVPENFDLHP